MPLLERSGKRGKRRKSKSGEMGPADDPTHIGPALVPPVAFAAVPKTPPPSTPPGTGVGLASSLLNTSTLGRLFAEPVPQSDEDVFSDPESSLYDYQQMEEAGYVSVEFGTLPQGRHSISERARARTPTSSLERQRINENEEDDMERQIITDIYSVPNKGKYQKQFLKDSGGSDGGHQMKDASLAGTTHDVRQAMQAVHDLPPFDIEEMTERQQVNQNLHPSPDFLRGSGRKGTGSKHASARRSLKLKDKQNDVSTDGRQSEMTSQHAQEVDSGIDPNHLTDGEMARNPSPQFVYEKETECKKNDAQQTKASPHSSLRQGKESVHDRNMELEIENQRLEEITQHLHAEVTSLRKIAMAINEGDTESAQSLVFHKHIDELKDENEVMKMSVHRLNMELSNYQAKQVPFSIEQCREIKGLPAKGPIPSWLISKRYLAPLFLAYDDQLQEKDDIILKYQEELQALKFRADEIVRENNQLQMAVGGTGVAGRTGSTEWHQVKDQARLVLEENQLLMEQLDVQQKKSRDMYEAHTQEVSRLTKKLSALDFEKTELERELEETKLKMKEFKYKNDSLMLNSQANIPVQEHINAVASAKRSVAEEREELLKKTEHFEVKMKALEDEQRALMVKFNNTEAENNRLHAEISSLRNAVRRAQHKLLLFQKAVEQSEHKELFTQDQLASIIKVAEKTAVERDTYAKVARERQQESKKAMNKAFAGTLAVGKLEEKLKLYKMKTAAKFNTVTERMKYQDESFNSRCQEYEREIKCLRLLLQDKEMMVQSVEKDKRDIENDLECVWQAANSENMQIKDTMRKSLRKLREHSTLSKMLDNEVSDKHELLNLSTDDES